MASVVIGAEEVRECGECHGLWIDVAAFEKICASREQEAVVLGMASPAPANDVRETGKVSYVPCPECEHLMNRINFARCSGVIVDVCKGHGTWFDQDELSRIIEFIRAGGLEVKRAREKSELEEERRHLRAEQLTIDRLRAGPRGVDEEQRILGIASARGLLKLLLD